MVEAPYAKIVAELRHRIESGQLRPGDRMPSTRQIVRDWGVAMATATKALTTLRQEGLVHTVPGAGSVVAPVAGRQTVRRERTTPEPSRQQAVRAAIEIADAEGLSGLSMRRLAGELGIATMSLYKYVPGKDELLCAMVDAAYGDEPLPGRPPPSWRERVELVLRLQWRLYRRHPWLAGAMSISRPQATTNGMAFTEWILAALTAEGLKPTAALDVTIAAFSLVRGLGLAFETEAQARAETGITDEQWLEDRHHELTAVADRFPALARVVSEDYDADLDRLFETGMACFLDGVQATLDSQTGLVGQEARPRAVAATQLDQDP